VLIPKVVNVKVRTFFYVSGQKYTDRQLGTGETLTGAPTEAGRQILNQFASRPAVKALLDFLPAAQTPIPQTATFTTGGQTYTVPLGSLAGAASQKFDDWQWMLRGDHRINDQHSFTSRWLYQNSLNSGTGQTTPPGYTRVVPSRRNALTAALMSTFSPTVFNELRASFQRLSTTTSAADPRSELIPSIEVPELGLTGFNAATSRTAIGLAVNLPQFRRNNT
jgi:hypothetical protein